MHSTSGIRTLAALADRKHYSDAVKRQELTPGDLLLVRTRNSLYSIGVLADDHFSVSGGWFESHGLAPLKIGINGCTHGGRAIRPDLIAARGLFLEFGNRVLTTRIQDVQLIRAGDADYRH